MSWRIKTDELELVEAIDRYGSVGAAAKELMSTQPSASRKLARLERRLGLVLFERDTTGARATSAGRDLAQRSRQLLADLDALPQRLQALAGVQDLRLGTIQALAPMVFTAARFELPGIEIKPEIDHGPALIEMVQAGLLDAAIIAIAEQTPRMSGLQSTLVGTSPLVLVIPEGAGAGTGKKPCGVVKSSIPCLTSRESEYGKDLLHWAYPRDQARRARPPCASPGMPKSPL